MVSWQGTTPVIILLPIALNFDPVSRFNQEIQSGKGYICVK